MGFYEYLLIAGAIVAVVLGVIRFSRIVSYIVFLVVAGWPAYTLGAKHGWSFGTVIVMVAVVFAVYAGLYWLGGRFNRKPA